MIEAAMYIALGFALATLVATAIFPAVYRRAVRLTKEALLAVNPSTYAEVRAAQDFERASHAIEMRQVEEAMAQERETSARHRLESGRLTAETIKLKATHKKEIEALTTALEEARTATGARMTKTAAMTRELAHTKARLADTERALAELRATADVSATAPAAPDASDPLVQTTIAGLELQVATLKAQLEKDGRKGAITDPLLLTNAEDLRKIIKSLEAELVDAETRFISAQAEVARLSVAADPKAAKENNRVSQLESDLKRAEDEKASLAAQLKDKDRTLKRAKDQVAGLRADLAAALQLQSDPLGSTSPKADDLAKDAVAPAAGQPEDQTPGTLDLATTSASGILDATALVNRIIRAGNAETRTPGKNTQTSGTVEHSPADGTNGPATADRATGKATGTPGPKTGRAKKRDVA